MTSYRLFPSTAGPAAGQSYSGPFLAGVCFQVTQGGCWFQGYWWWVPATTNTTAAQKFALWSVTSSTAGVLIASATITSGTLTAGAWNYVPLASPVQLAIGSPYIAATGVNGNFPDTNSQFGSGNPYAAGITSGPLMAYSDQTGSAPAPYTIPQGCFTTGGSDPTTTMPQGGSSSGNFWMDVQVSTTAPAGYAGTYRLWPNKWDANPVTGGDTAANYDVCTEVHLAQTCTLAKLWYYSPSGAASLATKASVWSVSSGSIVASNAAPSWSGAAGSGWVWCTISGTLPAGAYRAGVYNSGGTGGGWNATDASSDYWHAGVGGSGISNGPISAPNQASASSGWTYNAADSGASPPYSNGVAAPAQSVFGQTPGGTDIFPQLYATGGGGQTQNYWADLEVTPVAVPAGLDGASRFILDLP